jgi:hypothetical protein
MHDVQRDDSEGAARRLAFGKRSRSLANSVFSASPEPAERLCGLEVLSTASRRSGTPHRRVAAHRSGSLLAEVARLDDIEGDKREETLANLLA